MTQTHAERIAEIEKRFHDFTDRAFRLSLTEKGLAVADLLTYTDALLARVAKLLEQIEDCEKIRHEAFGFAIGPDGYLPEAVADAIQDYDKKWRST